MIRPIHRVRVANSLVALFGEGAWTIAVDSIERRFFCYKASQGKLHLGSIVTLPGDYLWTRSVFPMRQTDSYFRTNSFFGAIEPSRELVAVSTPDLALSTISMNDARVLASFGSPGECRSVAWAGEWLITNRLTGDLKYPTDIVSNARLYNVRTNESVDVGESLVGLNIASDVKKPFVTIRDDQGESLVFVRENQFPFQAQGDPIACYVRPDSAILNQTGTTIAILELDTQHRVAVLDLQTGQSITEFVHDEETTRPEEALNGSLIAFAESGDRVFFPVSNGSLLALSLLTGEYSTSLTLDSEVVGVSVNGANLTIAESNGHVSLWEYS